MVINGHLLKGIESKFCVNSYEFVCLTQLCTICAFFLWLPLINLIWIHMIQIFMSWTQKQLSIQILGFVDHFYGFWIRRPHHFYLDPFGPFSWLLYTKTSEAPNPLMGDCHLFHVNMYKFLDPEMIKMVWFMDPEIVEMVDKSFMIQVYNGSVKLPKSRSKLCTAQPQCLTLFQHNLTSP